VIEQAWQKTGWLTWPVVLIAVQQVLFPAPIGSVLQGSVLGLITALVTMGMYLVYRANRVLNFSAGELGLLPAVLAVLLITESGLNWYLSFGIGLAASLAVGVAAEFLIIRRFFDSPRLVVTVATIGLAQLLGVAALFMPAWWDTKITSQRIDAPFRIDFTIGVRVFSADHVLVWVLAPLAMVAVAALLRFTRLGVAIRAAAEMPARAGMLGIPVKALQSVVWGLATALAFLALFLRAGVFGLPVGGLLGLLLLLRALASLMLGRLTHLPTMLAGAVSLGVLQEGVLWNSNSQTAAEAKMAGITGVVIIAALLLRRDRGLRSDTEFSGWQSVGDVRPIPPDLAGLAIVNPVRYIGFVLIAALALLAPRIGFIGTEDILRLGVLYIFAIILLSLGVLTGWAGQLSLGQMAFAAIGAAVSAKLTTDYGFDLILATMISGMAGAASSLVIGLPALRLRGAYLAVTSLAFGLTVSQYLLNPRFFGWIPTARVERHPVLGRIGWESSTAVYYVSLVGMIAAFVAVRGIRHSRTGRVLIAIRDNENATESFGVSTTRAKLTAFAVSGFLAATAGSLLVHHQQAFVIAGYDAQSSIGVFTAAVIGGMGSVLGSFLGAAFWFGTFFWLKGTWRVFASGIGVLIVLMIAPSGLAGLWYDLRDLTLRWIAGRSEDADLESEIQP